MGNVDFFHPRVLALRYAGLEVGQESGPVRTVEEDLLELLGLGGDLRGLGGGRDVVGSLLAPSGGLGQQRGLPGVERGANVCFADVNPGRNQIAQQLADHVLVAGFLKIGLDHGLGIGFGFNR